MRCVVIMAGGRGERFWPKSRRNYPKQFLNLIGDKSMLQYAYERALDIVDKNRIFIVTSSDLVNLVEEQIPKIPQSNIIIEPLPKNTAPAIGLAATYIRKYFGDYTMFVMPSDHYVDDLNKFYDVVEAGFEAAEKYLSLITLGIKPSRPDTGYGYIEVGNIIDTFFSKNIFEVKRFVEKPNHEKAVEYLSKGKFFWNSGMFIWKVSTILEEISKHMPNLWEALTIIEDAIGKDYESDVIIEEFEKIEGISIDYGVMEKSKSVLCVKSDFIWDDIGSWSAVYRLNDKDDNGNVIEGNVISHNVKNSLIIGENDGVIAVSSLEDMIIIKEGDSILITKKSEDQTIRELVKMMKNQDKYSKYL
ncbi:MAG: mannose-1-phosphate guanylyltransferase [Brevinematales bacterium]|nr:mannose-1-phosphate guanylyltransferase [Brevinematales bacterium]